MRQEKRKEKIVSEMKEILARLREKDPDIPPSTPHVVSDKNMARLIAETGPLGDFNHCAYAVVEAKKIYPTADGCAHCSPECHRRCGT